jgi:hypothetical protein
MVKFVLALGNRPKGERTAYVITLWCVELACCLTALLKVDIPGCTLSWPFTCLCVPLRLPLNHSW